MPNKVRTPSEVFLTKEAFVPAPSCIAGQGRDKLRYFPSFFTPSFQYKSSVCSDRTLFISVFVELGEISYFGDGFTITENSLKLVKELKSYAREDWTGRWGRFNRFGGFGQTGLQVLNPCPISRCIRMPKAYVKKRTTFITVSVVYTSLLSERCKQSE